MCWPVGVLGESNSQSLNRRILRMCGCACTLYKGTAQHLLSISNFLHNRRQLGDLATRPGNLAGSIISRNRSVVMFVLLLVKIDIG